MDMLTIDDLTAAGFVNFRYKGAKNPKTLIHEVLEDPKRIVHASVPVFDSMQSSTKKYPVIEYFLGSGFEARWGAMSFHLRSELELWRFMKVFNYPLPIDHK